jgi:ribosomal protein S18 acetylase RimI-like enzyme
LRELYPQLPHSPLPAVITCVATTPEARRRGHARHLIEDVCSDLAVRGFAAVEAYPDLTRPDDETSAGRPNLWLACGFVQWSRRSLSRAR